MHVAEEYFRFGSEFSTKVAFSTWSFAQWSDVGLTDHHFRGRYALSPQKVFVRNVMPS